MCGRYSVYSTPQELEERFHASLVENAGYSPHFNAAPSQLLPAILDDAPESITLATWGFLPHWVKETSKIRPQINARVETVHTKPMFRTAIKRDRCLVVSDGFFEWDKKGSAKKPYRIRLKSQEPFAFAGIWSSVNLGDGMSNTFAILTTKADGVIARIHDRMPIILHPEHEEAWLDESLKIEDLAPLLTPVQSDMLEMYEVGTKVNVPRNDTQDILTPVH